MLDMATEKEPKGRGRPAGEDKAADATEPKKTVRQKPKFGFHLPAALLNAFQVYCDEQDPKIDYTQAAITAFREFLTKRGAWPAKKAE